MEAMSTVRSMITAPRPVRALALAAAAALTLAVAGCGSDSDSGSGSTQLRVGPLSTANTLSLALSDGTLADSVEAAGGSVEGSSAFASFSPAAEALAADQIDMSSGSSTSVITALQGNPDLVIFAVEQGDNDTQGIVAHDPISSIEDLAGKKIAINEGGTGDYLARTALESAGMSVDDVTLVNLTPPDAATAFSSGQVDAWATWDQYLASAQQQDGTTTVALAKDIGATNRTVHVVSRAFLDAHPQEVVAAYDALTDQADAVIADPQILVDAYVDAGADQAVAEAIGALTPPSIEPADADFETELQSVADFYTDQGLLDGSVDVSDAVVDVDTLR